MDATGTKRRRAQKACHFCRQRKMRCGNEDPACHNCVAYKEECFYDQGPKKARPSNSRISRLEEENRLLQERLAKIKGRNSSSKSLATHPTPADDSSNENSDASEGNESSSSAESSSKANIKNVNPEFHGPTGVLFDETASMSKQQLRKETSVMSSERASSSLTAEAEAQRQLEGLHLSSNQLDFDGVAPNLATELLSLFWMRSNPLFMLIYRPVFMRDWACGGPYFSKLLLNAIYFNASRYITDASHGADGMKLGERFRKQFKELLSNSYDKSRITTMQGLLLVAVSLSAVGKDRSLAWLYSGIGFRMMFDLGLHTSSPYSIGDRKLSPEDLESNRRLFWSAYVIDKLQSFYQGRPANVQEADTLVPLIFQDEFEEREHWHPLPSAPSHGGPYAPMYSVTTFRELCKLAIIMNKILNKIYREKNEVEEPTAIIRSLNQLNMELEEWKHALPLHIKLSPPSVGREQFDLSAPHVYVLLLMFHVVQILLHRPFVSYGHLQSVLPEVAVDSFSTCASAANSIAKYFESYDRVHSFKFAPFFLFYASYVSATIHVRIAAQRQVNSDAVACLDMCLSVYDQNALNNPAVKKAKAVIQKLMDRMGVKPTDMNASPVAAMPSPKESRPPPVNYNERLNEARLNEPATPVATPHMYLSQDYNLEDLDINAVLQSLSRPGAEMGNVLVSAVDFSGPPQLTSQCIHGSSQFEAPSDPVALDYMYHFEGGIMDDSLFGFSNSGKEDEWASPQSGSSSY